MEKQIAGFREHEHTADWELEVWAPDLPQLLEQSAVGMNYLSQIRLSTRPRVKRTIEFQVDDFESLLVDFLNELLYLGEEEELGFDAFSFRFDANILRAKIEGAPIAFQAKEIKAVTFHNMNIRETEHGLKVNIVFDV